MLHSDVVPRAEVRRALAAGLHGGFIVVRCVNPACRSRGAERLLSLNSFPGFASDSHPIPLPVLPCPSCPGAAINAWALTRVRAMWASDPSGLEVVHYPVVPDARPTLALQGPVATVLGAQRRPTWGSCWNPAEVQALPRMVASLRAHPTVAHVFDALRVGASAGVALAWTLDANNLRALVDHVRAQPFVKRADVVDALAHAFQPRRSLHHRTEHDVDGAEHHPYIAFNAVQFAERIRFLGYSDHGGRFLDVGCGVGEKPFLAWALGAFAESDGVEFNPQTVAVARYLLGLIAADTPYPIRIFQGDAVAFADYDRYDLIYMFRPIRDRPQMGVLLRRIMESMAVGAVTCDAIDQRMAFKRVSDHAWVTYDPEVTTHAEWTVPVPPFDELLPTLGLGPE